MSTNEDIDMDYFITLVEEREILWDKSNVDFKNKNMKSKAWEQIAIILFPEYANFDINKKNRVCYNIVKRWRNVKDNFYKYLKKIKESSKSGSEAKNLKKYHFFNQLLFLKKVAPNDTDSSLDLSGEISPDFIEDTAPESSRYVPITRKRKMESDDFEKEALQVLKDPENRHMSFFKGILPSIQDFTELQTLTFQSKVLKIITEMRYGTTYQSSSSYACEQTSRNYRSTHTPTGLNSDCNSLNSQSEIYQDSLEYNF